PPRAAGDRSRGGQLREVPPPEWVQRAREALEERDPQVRILAPAEGELLPDGPWTLRLEVSDWPLVEAGPLGLGPHLVVQLDGQAPRPVVDTEVEMPPLSPGSHLLTVYAAKPWGEAHKSPLAVRQRRLHRLAPNPATLPAPGTPQLIPVSPMGQAGEPPLLVDWLLVDAPLQGLRGDASGWRLRLTVNGESVLVDQQVPLWLQGWKQGSNALLLELLDGQGASLNPPFNSLLKEVTVSPPGAGSPQRPSPPATDLELAVLLGDQPVSALGLSPSEAAPSPPPAESALTDQPEPTGQPEPEVRSGLGVPAASEVPAVAQFPAPSSPSRQAPGASSAPPPNSAPVPLSAASPPVPDPPASVAPPPESTTTESPLSPLPASEPPEPPSSPATPPDPSVAASAFPSLSSEPPLPPAAPTPEPTAPQRAEIPPPDSLTLPPPQAPAAPPPARAELNPDGALRRPSPPSPLERLRERLGQ
ncbi:MAG: hypothetical protein VKP70_05815, partial [Cyanobacteriota bacterium]|nr:hypothetical protein [Cyanobacteriota bacterium]